MKRRDFFGVLFVCVAGLCPLQAAGTPDPAGDWKWQVTREDNVSVDYALKLKFADDKLTGTITIPNKDKFEIEDASFKDGEVIFSYKQKGGAKRIITTKFKGKLDGDTIKGTYESNRLGPDPKGEWEAKRERP